MNEITNSHSKKLPKILNRIVDSIPLLIILVTTSFSCRAKIAEPENIYIPYEYTGKVYVIYNINNGQPIQYEGKRRLYIINRNGVLITQFKPNYGYHEDIFNDIKFFLVKGQDTVSVPVIYGQITQVSDTFRDGDQKIVFNVNNGKYGNYDYESFRIDTKSNIENYTERDWTDYPEQIDTIFKQNNLEIMK